MVGSRIEALPAFSREGRLNVVIETPQGTANKLKWDANAGLFKLSHVLPSGAVFPFDFGFIPGTRGEDGDPLDVLLLIDHPVPLGCLVEARLIGVIEANQSKKGQAIR